MKIEKNLATSGERLKRVRILAGIATRREFEKKYSISANTLQGWEQGKNPLSEKGARRIIEALKKEGMICTVEWLIHGSGMPPRSFEMLNAGIDHSLLENNIPLSDLNLREEESIYKESQLFQQQNPNSILLTVADDALEPYYSLGDHIAGILINNNDIDKYIGKVCIVELENNLILPRFIYKGTQEAKYTISCSNPKTKSSPLNHYNIKIVSAAPILWHRRKLLSLQAQA